MQNMWNNQHLHLKLLVVFSIVCGVFCCNDGQFSLESRCFEAFPTPKSYEMARISCKALGAKIAEFDHIGVDSVQRRHQEFGLDLNKPYWTRINFTSSLMHINFTSGSDCSFLNLTDYSNAPCSSQMSYICEFPEKEDTLVCKQGSLRFRNKCLRYMTETTSHNQAITLCTLQLGALAVLDDPDKKVFVVNSLELGNSSVWVGADKVDERFQWSNGLKFTEEECTTCFRNESNQGRCVILTADPFVYEAADCSSKANVLCETSAQQKTTLPPTTTQAPALSCPHGYHWKLHEVSGWCYWETSYETERLNWNQAREFCARYGGDLASYKDYSQELQGIGGARGHARGLWIGLKRGIEDDVFRWSDGTSLTYTNWNSEEPNLASKTRYCVIHGSPQSRWELDYCGVRRWFVCKAPRVVRPTMPEIPVFRKTRCNFTSNSVYRDWYLFEDHCYMLIKTEKYSWDTAKTFCQDNGAHMVSVHSFDETDFIISLGAGLSESNYWIGLSARGLRAPLSWSDSTPVDFLYWNERDYSDAIVMTPVYDDMCVMLNDKDGSWIKSHCNQFRGVLCKRGLNSSNEFTSPPPTPVLPGFCPNGTYTLGNKCYKIIENKTSWEIAMTKCKDMGARLTSIHSSDEQDFLTDLVLEIGGVAWIGLRTRFTNIYKWVDESPIDFTSWDSDEPSERSSTMRCTVMDYSIDSMGKWKSESCGSNLHGYICQMEKDLTLNKPFKDPSECPTKTGWLKTGTSCFGIFEDEDEKATWLQAQTKCRLYGTNLMSVKNFGITLFLKRKLKKSNEVYWTGIRETLKNKYESLNGRRLVYTNWLKKQPQRVSELRNCVAIDSEGKWMVRDCVERHPFVCEQDNKLVSVVTPKNNSQCPGNNPLWQDFGGDQCFIIKDGTKSGNVISTESSGISWFDAIGYCFGQGGSLASFHSEEEVSKVLRHLDDTKVYHIGLGRLTDGSFGWVDRSPLDYTNWEFDEPGNPFEECAGMMGRTGKWKIYYCRYKSGYICSIPKIVSLSSDTAQAMNSTSQDESVKKRLEVGGILGIVICVTVILAIIAVASYYLCPSTRMRSRLMEPESP